MLSDEEVEGLRVRWQKVFDLLPTPPGAESVERSLFIVNIDTPRPVPIGTLKFTTDESAIAACLRYAPALREAGFTVDDEALPSPSSPQGEGSWHEFNFTGFGLPWVFAAKVESDGSRVVVHPDAVDAPGAPPIGEPPDL